MKNFFEMYTILKKNKVLREQGMGGGMPPPDGDQMGMLHQAMLMAGTNPDAVEAAAAGNWMVKLPAVEVLSPPNARTATALLP